MSTYLASIPVLLVVAGAIAALTARRLRQEAALAAVEVLALATLADDAGRVRIEAGHVASRIQAAQFAAARPGTPRDRARR